MMEEDSMAPSDEKCELNLQFLGNFEHISSQPAKYEQLAKFALWTKAGVSLRDSIIRGLGREGAMVDLVKDDNFDFSDDDMCIDRSGSILSVQYHEAFCLKKSSPEEVTCPPRRVMVGMDIWRIWHMEVEANENPTMDKESLHTKATSAYGHHLPERELGFKGDIFDYMNGVGGSGNVVIVQCSLDLNFHFIIRVIEDRNMLKSHNSHPLHGKMRTSHVSPVHEDVSLSLNNLIIPPNGI
ncbi:hypothetical protein GH714_014449 [Hevea brasiliensis]|uniref:Uncharacterized protein n=1 Tax=Hevea brasiliensis TaxID=3981 RepID=A0A6A6KIP9_HEVBR|nr:hypothetical protein GH714_014449 [Hevea brasiliensis]